MIPAEISEKLKHFLSKYCGKEISILRTTSIGGGCINNAVKLETTSGIFFLKWNDAQKFPSMFEAEAKGLVLLKSTHTIGIPEVITANKTQNYSFIVLEFIETREQQKNFWEGFGSALANIHKHTGELFGLNHDNYIGSLQQSNRQKKSWAEFFVSERLEKQILIAKNSGAIDHSTLKQFDNLFKLLPEIIPEEKPSLLHGDLWNGNFMTGADGKAWLIDPAVYYGHREMDLAMTRLFSGFSEEFYEAYNQTFPLKPKFSERIDFHNLYPLLVHINLFGGRYLQEVKNILSRL